MNGQYTENDMILTNWRLIRKIGEGSFEDHAVIPRQGIPGADVIIRMELLTPLLKY